MIAQSSRNHYIKKNLEILNRKKCIAFVKYRPALHLIIIILYISIRTENIY